MALINCKECGNSVSDVADKCPHCGYPLKNEIIPKTQIQDTVDNNIPSKYNTLCVIVFVMSILGLVPPITFIMSFFALNDRKSNEKGSGLAVIALVLSIIESVILLAVMGNLLGW